MAGYRGRLIRPQLAGVARLDTAATAAADPGDATGAPLGGGYDDTFREPVLAPATGSPVGLAPQRKEHDVVYLPCQVEVPRFNEMQQTQTGDDPGRQIVLVFHFADLEEAALVDAAGAAMIRNNDRLVGLYNSDGSLIEEMVTPLYATRCEPRSFGLAGSTRNLLIVTFNERAQFNASAMTTR